MNTLILASWRVWYQIYTRIGTSFYYHNIKAAEGLQTKEVNTNGLGADEKIIEEDNKKVTTDMWTAMTIKFVCILTYR